MQENEKSKQKKGKKHSKQRNHKYEICLMEMI